MPSRSLHVESLGEKAISDLAVEIIERKGQGHPDSLIDGASEAVSRALCDHYLKEFGSILHHNVDKGLLVGGKSEAHFGGGEVLEPIQIVVAGRATSSVKRNGGVYDVPVGELALSAIKNFLNRTMRFLDTETHVITDFKIRPGSADLVGVYDGNGEIPLSNDTSIGVGYSPLTPAEKLVLETERLLNSSGVKHEMPELGEDIKVMALRNGSKIDLTIAAAMISTLIPDQSHYVNIVEQTQRKVDDLVPKITDMDVTVQVNSGDSYSKGVYYLTVTGTSAEAGDDGNTGRGNRPNGLITSMRQYSMEATAGKNPVNHTGKIYNVLAQTTADKIFMQVKGIKEAYVRMLSRIGVPIDVPQIASAAVVLEKGGRVESVRSDIESIMDEELSKIADITSLILSGNVTLF